MGINIAPETANWIMFIIGFSALAWNLSGLKEERKNRKVIRHLHLELETCYREADELRAVIYDFESGRNEVFDYEADRSQFSTPKPKLKSVK